MSKSATDFMDDWLSENIHFTGYPDEEVPDPEAKLLAQRCVEDAKEEGISKADLENEFGDLPTFMHRRLERAADEEVRRQAEKDD